MLEWLIGDLEAERKAHAFYGDAAYEAIKQHERELWEWQQARRKTAPDRIYDVAAQVAG